MRKLLVALDGSAREAEVLRAGIALARKTGAELVLARVVGLATEVPPEALAVSPDAVTRLLCDRALRDLGTLESSVPSGISRRSIAAVGTPWPAIERLAREEDVDLIIIGSHGYGGLDRVLGTTAARVVNHADRSVLVVRAGERLEDSSAERKHV